jgi:glycosyltransferase involved in cell wall biosynthesis
MSAHVDSVSVVICAHDQAPRLALVLAGLANQTKLPHEVIVVDDHSTDGTAEVVRAAGASRNRFPIRYHRPSTKCGSPGARNEGAARARGDLLVFLDSDALPAPGLIEAHASWQEELGPSLTVGSLWQTTTTEYLRDPRTGERFPVEIPPAVSARLDADPSAHLVTLNDVLYRFALSIPARSRKGAYPHLGWMEEQAEAAGSFEGRRGGWLFFSPQNCSIRRRDFAALGGFDRTMPFCEGWDLALTALARGLPLARVGSARTYHLYHHRRFADFDQSLRRWRAMRMIAKKHDAPRVMLANLVFRFQGNDPWLPKEIGPLDFDHFERLWTAPGNSLGSLEQIFRGHPQIAELEAAYLRREAA